MKLSGFGLLQDSTARAELLATLSRFQPAPGGYPRDRTVHALFSECTAKMPDATAVEGSGSQISYGQLDLQSNRLARVLLDAGIERESFVGVFLDDPVPLATTLLGILKAGAAYCPMDSGMPYERLRYILDDTRAPVLISTRQHMRAVNRLQWDCPELRTILILDSDDARAEPETLGEKMKREVWDYVGQTMTDDISGGGWQSSFTGEWLSREVMDDYGENVRLKLAPRLAPDARVLEIGCSSGISMFRLAPLVREYVGTDLSPSILRWTGEEAQRRGATNIRLLAMPAHEIESADAGAFDAIILNSVLLCFSGHNYLRQVLRTAVARAKDQSLIFVGNTFDQDLKETFLAELRAFKRAHTGEGFRTKTDYSEELFINRAFFDDLRHDLPEIAEIEYSNLLGTHESELSRFTFDAVLRIDKSRRSAAALAPRQKCQLDRGALAAASEAALPERAGAEALAYVTYTSGTSGRPKGVLVEHRAIVRLVIQPNYVELDRGTRILMTGALAFDASTFEIWGALLNGGTLVRTPSITMLDSTEMKRLVQAHSITTMFLTTALFNHLADTDVTVFRDLQHLITGGERNSPRHMSLVRNAHPRLALIHAYGPTENTTFTTCHRVERNDEHDVPLGRPITGTEVLILDPAGEPVPIGIPGEICTAGDGLARGYLHDAKLSAERFTAHPLQTGRRIYRTGDRGRWNADGVIEFLGRMDEQVKIRGFRIEPSELEFHLRSADGVTGAVVLVQENGDGRELVAYVTGPVDAAELRDELKPKLPGYMMPAHLIVLDSFPLNANGKIDRKALPRPSVAAARGRLSLESETERTLAEIWKEVLGAPEVGATDDFFDIGGHSLKVTKVVAAIQRRLGMTVPIAAVFRRSTVRELARYLLDNAEFGVPRADGAMVCLGGPENGVQLFALPPGTGDVFSYMPFPALLPRYRLNAFNFIEAESRFCDYADLVGLAQPHGPCILLGYSGGGNLAFHVAAELERRGRQVSDIIMIDSGRILSPYPYLHDVVMRVATEFLADETIAPYCATPVLRDKVIRRIVGVHRLFAEMTDDQIIDANIHVVLANPPMLEARFEDRVISSVAAWKDATRGTFRTYAGEGNHAVMLTQPALAQNAAAIQSILARVAALAPSLPPRLLTGPERASTGVRPSS